MPAESEPTTTAAESAVAAHEQDNEARFKRVAGILIAAYLALALSHHGEFWPFSRFPMFANAEKPWLRATLRVLRPEDLDVPLREVGERDLPGLPFALATLRIDQNDLSEVLKRQGDELDAGEIALLQRYFGDVGEQTLLLYRVRGRLRTDRSLRVRYRPLALLQRRSVTAVTLDQNARGVSTP